MSLRLSPSIVPSSQWYVILGDDDAQVYDSLLDRTATGTVQALLAIVQTDPSIQGVVMAGTSPVPCYLRGQKVIRGSVGDGTELCAHFQC